MEDKELTFTEWIKSDIKLTKWWEKVQNKNHPGWKNLRKSWRPTKKKPFPNVNDFYINIEVANQIIDNHRKHPNGYTSIKEFEKTLFPMVWNVADLIFREFAFKKATENRWTGSYKQDGQIIPVNYWKDHPRQLDVQKNGEWQKILVVQHIYDHPDYNDEDSKKPHKFLASRINITFPF